MAGEGGENDYGCGIMVENRNIINQKQGYINEQNPFKYFHSSTREY